MFRCGLSLLALALLLSSGVMRAQNIMIVVSKTSPVSEITEAQLHDIFVGTRSHFSDGTRAIPVLLKGGPVHEVFLHRHVGDTPDEYRVRWRKAVFTGQGSMPKEFTSEAALLEYVSVTPGAIGYVSRILDTGAVKVLTISGR